MKTITIDGKEWQLVPVEPTWDMRNEGREMLIDGCILNSDPEVLAATSYKAMLAAAPEALTQDAPQIKRIHPLDVPLEVFLADLTTKPRNVIRAEMAYFNSFGDDTIKPPFAVRHLLMFGRSELKKWPGLGKKGLNEVEELLRERGLQLWESHDERSLRLLREHPRYFLQAAMKEQGK